jgi:hypothetical protein
MTAVSNTSYGAGRDLRVGGPVHRPVGIARNDLAAAMPASGVVDEAGYQQRTLLHQTMGQLGRFRNGERRPVLDDLSRG